MILVDGLSIIDLKNADRIYIVTGSKDCILTVVFQNGYIEKKLQIDKEIAKKLINYIALVKNKDVVEDLNDLISKLKD
ncbi:MAG: hypothetical protein QW540_08155 [Archaeoglobaceae archaeon]